MLIDVHAHFYTAVSGRWDWRERDARRLEVGGRLGITAHIASILGTWGRLSPTYFPAPDDVTLGNAAMLQLQRAHPGLVFGYCTVNPNYGKHALEEIDRWLGEGMVGVKLAASRRASDPLLDPIADAAARHGVPILHHVWQHRRRDWPGQEASDAAELAALAVRHPNTKFILAHIGGGGDWSHSLRVVRKMKNIWVDLSGSGVDVDMLHTVIRDMHPTRLVWGTDATMCTGWAKLRYLETATGLAADRLALIRSDNALELFRLEVGHAGH
ncbi:MAG: amidohydrolase family protein [Gemmatimonadota bacterium]|nr:amidohydrolase family protein [Gemmatimonadota bacterium]